jgi:hypothetical protein
MKYRSWLLMKHDIDIHVCIISWSGKEVEASNIASSLIQASDRVTVVYSNAQEVMLSGPGNWIQVPDAWFYGRKFARWLAVMESESAGLVIQADAQCDDWEALLRAFRQTLTKRPRLGVWVPEIDGTPYRSAFNNLWQIDGELTQVGLIDGITWGMSSGMIDRMRKLEYKGNNLGWGIEFAAVATAYAQGLDVLRYCRIGVQHIQGAGYSASNAASQQQQFLQQLTKREQRWLSMLKLNHRAMAFAAFKLGRMPFIGKITANILKSAIRVLLKLQSNTKRSK